MKAEFLSHLTASHEQKLIEHFDKNVKKDEEEKKVVAPIINQMDQLNLNFDRISRIKNSAMRDARLG